MTEPSPGQGSATEPLQPPWSRPDGPGLARIVAELRASGCVWAEEEAAQLVAAAHSPAELDGLVARRVAGEPLEHVIGWAELASLRVRVAPGVFVPRHRSEHLISVASELLTGGRAAPDAQIAPRPDHAHADRSGSRRRVASRRRSDAEPGAALERGAGPEAPIVLDLCAGSGALGLALFHRAGPFTLVAADLDPRAVACAAENLAGVGGVAVVGDLFDPVPTALLGRVDLILANAPYVPTAALALLPHEARDHEPQLALDGGPDGLAVHRRIIAEAPQWLAPGGSLLVELAEGQVPDALPLFTAAGLEHATRPAPDDPGTVVVVGTRSGRARRRS